MSIKLYNVDSLQFMKTMADNSVDLIVTDPPYDIVNTNAGKNSGLQKSISSALSELDNLNISNGYDFEAFNNEFVRIMKNINIYIYCNKTQIPQYFDFYVNKLGCKFDILFWYKPNALPTYSNKYLTDVEYCLYFRKGGKCNPQSYEDATTLFIEPINIKDKKIWGHPTIKPLPMVRKLIRNSSDENDIVFDPFMGSGTTGVAAILEKRQFIGCEIDKGYYEMAEKRINKEMSNKKLF